MADANVGTVRGVLLLEDQWNTVIDKAEASTKKITGEFNKTDRAVSSTTNQINQMGQAIARTGDQVAGAQSKISTLGSGVTQVFSGIGNTISNLFGGIKNSTTGLFTGVIGEAAKMAAGFFTAQIALEAVGTAVRAVTGFISDGIKEYAEAEAAQKRLTTALRQQSMATPQVIEQYQALGKEFQRTTVFEDDLITSMEAMLVQVGGVMPAKMKEALQAATDLSAGLGIDLETATRLVAKAAAGHTETLGRYGITVSDAAKETKGFDATLEAINRQFGGQAAAQIETYAGQVQQAANAWNNLKEVVGEFILTNEFSKLAMREASDALKRTEDSVDGVNVSIASLVTRLTGSVSIGAFVAILESMVGAANRTEAALRRLAAMPSPFEKWQQETTLPDISKKGEAEFDRLNKIAEEAAAKSKKAAEDYANAISKLTDAMSGKDLLAQAQQFEVALKKTGGASSLTSKEVKQYSEMLDRVIEKYKALGKLDVVAHFTKLKASLSSVSNEMRKAVEGIEQGAFGIGNAFEQLESTPIPAITLDIFSLTNSVEQLQRKGLFTEANLKKLGTTIGILPNVTPRATKAIEELGDAVEETFGQKLKTGLFDILQGVPQTIVDAMTGGGGLLGAIAGIGSQVGSLFGRTIGESISTAATGLGSLAGPIGAALGSLIGPLITKIGDLFTGGPEWKKLAKDIGRDFGVNVSDALAQSMEANSKQFGRQIASLLDLNKIIEEGGGVEEFGMEKALKHLRDAFAVTGITAKQQAEILEENFELISGSVDKATGLISEQAREILYLAQSTGTASAKMQEFIAAQMQIAATGIGKALEIPDTALTKITDIKKQLEALGKTRADVKGEADLKKWDELTAQLQKTQALFDLTAVKSTDTASAISTTFISAFEKARASGMSFGDAAKSIEAPFKALENQLIAAGISGGEAFDKLRSIMSLATDEVAGPALTALNGYVQGLTGLHNANALTQQDFSALTGQIGQIVTGLQAQGFTQEQVLGATSRDLQTIFELQQRYGYELDATTQKLLDDAVAAGAVGEAHMSAGDRMVLAAERTAAAIEAIAVKMGAIPAAAVAAANGANLAFQGIKDKDVKITPKLDPGAQIEKFKAMLAEVGDTGGEAGEELRKALEIALQEAERAFADTADSAQEIPDETADAVDRTNRELDRIRDRDITIRFHYDMPEPPQMPGGGQPGEGGGGGTGSGEITVPVAFGGASAGFSAAEETDMLAAHSAAVLASQSQSTTINFSATNNVSTAFTRGPELKRYLDETVGEHLPGMILRDVGGIRRVVNKVGTKG